MRPTLRSRPIEAFAEGRRRRRGEFEIRQSESRTKWRQTRDQRLRCCTRDFEGYRLPRHSRRRGALPLHLLPEPGLGARESGQVRRWPLPRSLRALVRTFHKFGGRRAFTRGDLSITMR